VVTLTTVGYGDIVPQNDLERGIAVLYMFIGVIFYSITIGSISGYLQEID